MIAALQALLFVAGDDGISLTDLSQLLGKKAEVVTYHLMRLAKKLAQDNDSGLRLTLIDGRFQLVTKKNQANIVQQYAISPFSAKLSQAALESLAIIAYRQPITRLEIDEIRGVQSSAMLQKLLQRDLIEVVGRQNSPGRPLLYQVSDYFYQYFGLSSLDQLPDLTSLAEANQAEETSLFDFADLDIQED
ncbi:segregation/condensation protein B [Aerococcus urinaehominis]|uniref:Segregation and condensation protein B n=1 Tax=Aerococcus urinaehominis TaxID=128944 RepID=A0A0X8FLW5_9LACT|nr:SMC-Scp complex subunit ScpB [Aerococcus urinaehominis]AMB99705.1 segregation/condensation protein B [Aerococcus urinaehominis]SDL91276.1 segregation and condensation protein B [Aerococcus urinaehominis]